MKLPTTLTILTTLLPLNALAICHDGWVGVGLHKECPHCPEKRAGIWKHDCTLIATSEGDDNYCDAHDWPASTNVQCKSPERGSEVAGIQVEGKGYGFCRKSASREQNKCAEDVIEWCCKPL